GLALHRLVSCTVSDAEPALSQGCIAPTCVELMLQARAIIGRQKVHEANYRHCWLSRAPRVATRRAPEQRHELAALHSITSSARASRVGRMSRSTCANCTGLLLAMTTIRSPDSKQSAPGDISCRLFPHNPATES